MKKLLSILLLFLIIACENKKDSSTDNAASANKDLPSEIETKEAEHKISFKKYEKDGILLKGEISLFDEKLNQTGKLTVEETSKIQILEKSTEMYNINKSEDNCLKSNFLKIKYKNQDYLLFGDQVYEGDEQGKFDFVNSKNEKYSIFSIKNFQMGASDDVGLTGCDDFSILLVLNQNSNKFFTITAPKENGNYSNQKIATLIHDDGSGEEIYRAQVSNDTLTLGIKIGYQEGYGSYFLKTNIQDNFSQSVVIDRVRFEDEKTFNSLK
ncbi:hypothetical protein [Flavobacterium reichenbachii]|uniref:Lipoprotein n=1 Tax=Flavobacterium reichenbachii TaxID=362418 RepID=A0A085ZIJ9_9FLAO|nr:hypothetical protein [Flavobacterium reichenbachii]KFF04263.1 hypothetical protein IW19_01415 [Flavobacterium reichenbachii]OXB13840.1 hypothetical protein B0A68_13905 [Flavobacterium reichenbachii]